jgi:hypothetical protein
MIVGASDFSFQPLLTSGENRIEERKEEDNE